VQALLALGPHAGRGLVAAGRGRAVTPHAAGGEEHEQHEGQQQHALRQALGQPHAQGAAAMPAAPSTMAAR
jgi:hypothetical protein